MSIRRYLPPIGTAGLERLSVRGNRRVPRPPPRMIANTSSIEVSVSPPATGRYFGAAVSGSLPTDHDRDFVLVVAELLDPGEGRPHAGEQCWQVGEEAVSRAPLEFHGDHQVPAETCREPAVADREAARWLAHDVADQPVDRGCG